LTGVSTDWQDVKYRETLEEELRGLERRLLSDPSCTADDLEGALNHLYTLYGQDWGGRGEVQNVALEATIAAYENIIARLRKL
jgi:hypothetical protein